MYTSTAKAQRASLRHIDNLISVGEKNALAEVTWTIGANGVTGKVDTILSSPAQAREDFAEWAAVIGAEVREHGSEDGTIYLTASTRYFADRIVVIFRATLESA